MSGTIIHPEAAGVSSVANPASRGPAIAAALAAASAVALYYAQPGTGGTGLLAWIALIPFLAVIDGRGPAAAAAVGLLWGLVYNLLCLVWVRPFGAEPWIGLAGVQALNAAAYAAVASRLLARRGWVAVWGVAVWWALFEALRSFVSFGLSWGDLADSQAGFGPALATASWWGAIGVSTLVALVNAALYALVRARGGGRACRAAPLGLAVTAAAVALGAVRCVRYRTRLVARLRSPAAVRVGLAQANSARDVSSGRYADPESTFGAYEALTDQLAVQGCRWVIWPESAIPEAVPGRFVRLARLAERDGVYLLAGGGDGAGDVLYNAMYCFGPDGRLLDVYHKRRLVPFGEFVPWRAHLPSLARFGVPALDLRAGGGAGIVAAGRLKVGVGICFESLFSDLALRQARAGAGILAVATNDSFYGTTPAASFHAASLRLRSAETGLPAVQAAVTGISFAALPDGEVPALSRPFTRDAVAVTLPPSEGPTIWDRAGGLVQAALAIVALAALAAAARGRVSAPRPSAGRRRRTARPSAP